VLAVVPLWLPLPDEPLSVGPTPVLRAEGRLDVEGRDADEEGVAELELPDADADVLASGPAVLAGAGLAGQEGELAGRAAFLLPAGLVLAVAVAEAVVLAVLAVPVALLLAVAVDVAVAAVVPVAEALPLSLGLTLVPSLPGVLLVLPLGGTVPEAAGGTLGSALLDLADLDALADEEGDGQAVACALLWLADELKGPAPPFAEPAALPEPARLGVPSLGLEEEIPTADPSETRASRSGGSARTTPMANTAQAAARTGLSSPSRQSRGRCRERPLPPRADSSPPRPAFQRPARPARNPPGARERRPAWAGPDRTRARIRSSPSGRGSTWSAAACSARRRYSPNSVGSGPCGGMPSNPDLVITRAPGPRAGRTCRARCGS
jgi:hypothetical protein